MDALSPTTIARTAEPEIQYWQAYRFPFASPNGWRNLMFGSVCMLIPIVGPLVWIGYLAEMLDLKLRSAAAGPRRGPDPSPAPDRAAAAAAAAAPYAVPPVPVLAYGTYATSLPYPDFDFNRFSAYLMRGLWPFLAQMVLGLLFVPLMMLGLLPAMFAPALELEGLALAAVIAAGVLLYLVAVTANFIASIPVSLGAALTQEFAAAFSWTFLKDFTARVWPQLLLTALFLFVTAVPLMIVGYAMCFVGLYPAMALLYFASWHLEYQLYLLYLHRGGTPIPLKPLPPPFPAWPAPAGPYGPPPMPPPPVR